VIWAAKSEKAKTFLFCRPNHHLLIKYTIFATEFGQTDLGTDLGGQIWAAIWGGHLGGVLGVDLGGFASKVWARFGNVFGSGQK